MVNAPVMFQTLFLRTDPCRISIAKTNTNLNWNRITRRNDRHIYKLKRNKINGPEFRRVHVSGQDFVTSKAKIFKRR